MSLGNIASFVNEPYRTFQEEVAGALNGKEFLLVETGTANNSVKLNTAAGNEVGVMFEKLQPITGQPDVNIRLLGGDGTVKVIQNGAIAYGARVIADPAEPTKVIALPGSLVAAHTYRVLGRKVSEGGGAAGDVIELADRIETVTVAAAA